MQRVTQLALCAAAALMVEGKSVRAEFQLTGQVGLPPTAGAAAETDNQVPLATRPAAVRSVKPALARGFGRKIPLSFAILQVVPRGMRVVYSENLDPNAVIVDWQGGRPWPNVLRSLLQPPGLLVTFKPGSVLITRPPA